MTDQITPAGSLAPRQRSRRLVINRAPEPSEVQVRLEKDRRRYSAGIVDPNQFASELAVEFARRQRGGRNCAVAAISLFEIPGIAHRHGQLYVFDLITELTQLLQRQLAPNDVFHVAENGDVLILGRDSTVAATFDRVQELCLEIAGRRWDADGENLLLTPSAGLATLDDGDDAAVIVRRAVDAREAAGGHLDLRLHRWEPAMSLDTAPAAKQPFTRFKWQKIKERLRAPSQLLATYVIGLFIPFCIYWFFDRVVGFDITWGVYLFCVATLVSTGVMILVEARLAIRQKEPPEVESYPDASAIICAYLPNEASTIIETLDAFLNQGYPGNLQIILAYNTPNPMAVERELHRMADENPLLEVVKVEGSTSKAQNVNAVLHMATGEFTGMFDADHMPRPGSFERAWRWLANGYDVVQGHCLTRNGEETWLARMIAVEFESIYAVAHPGRAKLHRFGVFGGSNGYWRTDLLHETRMRGSMLTEDIDSSMRTVERGLKIRSDRDVVSRELGTTTMKQVWNQRLRWAQGWFQVTMMHTLRVWRSPGLNVRQKFGATYLLGWREVYPWLSLQVFPLVAYWFITRGDTLSYGWPIFFFTTIFVLHVGPHQTWYAYKLADPEIKQHKSWFWGYLLFSTFFYTEFKNTVARVAHVKEFVGERAWKVTPRSDKPVEFDDDADVFGADEDEAEANEDELSPRRVRGPIAAEQAMAASLASAARSTHDSNDHATDDSTSHRAAPSTDRGDERARPDRTTRLDRFDRDESGRLADLVAGLRAPSVLGDPLLGQAEFTVDATDAFGRPRRRRVEPTNSDSTPAAMPRDPLLGQTELGGDATDAFGLPRRHVRSNAVGRDADVPGDPLLGRSEFRGDVTDAFGLPRRRVRSIEAPSERTDDETTPLRQIAGDETSVLGLLRPSWDDAPLFTDASSSDQPEPVDTFLLPRRTPASDGGPLFHDHGAAAPGPAIDTASDADEMVALPRRVPTNRRLLLDED